MISDILRRKCDRYDCSIGMVRCNVDRSIMCFNDSFGNCETKAGTVFFCCKEWFIKLINNFRWNTTAVILALNQNFIVKFSLHETADVGHTYNRQERLWHL